MSPFFGHGFLRSHPQTHTHPYPQTHIYIYPQTHTHTFFENIQKSSQLFLEKCFLCDNFSIFSERQTQHQYFEFHYFFFVIFICFFCCCWRLEKKKNCCFLLPLFSYLNFLFFCISSKCPSGISLNCFEGREREKKKREREIKRGQRRGTVGSNE